MCEDSLRVALTVAMDIYLPIYLFYSTVASSAVLKKECAITVPLLSDNSVVVVVGFVVSWAFWCLLEEKSANACVDGPETTEIWSRNGTMYLMLNSNDNLAYVWWEDPILSSSSFHSTQQRKQSAYMSAGNYYVEYYQYHICMWHCRPMFMVSFIFS